MTDSFRQYVAANDQQVQLAASFHAAFKEIVTGLCELNREGAADDYFHLPILLISTGIEQFIKTFIRLRELETTGNWTVPDSRKPKPGNRTATEVHLLLSQMIPKTFSPEFFKQHPDVFNEIRLLQKDDRITRTIDTFTNFSMGARYYNLNIVSGIEPPGACHEDDVDQLREEIIEEGAIRPSRIPPPGENIGIDKEICNRITIASELIVRTLCRLLVSGRAKNEADQLLSHTHHFLSLSDNDLGTTDYGLLKI